jgi:KDO2-lipid IV(A) lauroyltransferase
MNFITAGFFIFFMLLVGLIPFRLLYVFSDGIRFLLYHVIGYRRKVIESNLRRSFPEWSEKQYQEITRKSYINLTDIIIEGVKAFTMSKKKAIQRYKILNPEVSDAFYKQGKSVMFVLGHYGNWEWGTVGVPLQFMHEHMIILYKPLSNQYIDSYIRKNRSRSGSSMVSIKQTGAVFKQQEGKPTIFVLVADQSPGNSKKAIWTDFLGQDTAFLPGPEKYALSLDMPVIFVDIQRVKRGYYELTLSLLSKHPAELPKGELTKLYAQKLESIIRKHPEDWLWSHKRWKHKRK